MLNKPYKSAIRTLAQYLTLKFVKVVSFRSVCLVLSFIFEFYDATRSLGTY